MHHEDRHYTYRITARLANCCAAERSRPDVVCLQGAKAPQEKFPEGADPGCRLRGSGTAEELNGVAILARVWQ
jgi:exonuclease III